MVRLTVSDEQAKLIRGSSGSLEIVDSDGNRIGFFTQPITSEEIEEAKRRSLQEPTGVSIDEVWRRLRQVESS